MQVRRALDSDREQIHQVRKLAWHKAYKGILPDDVIAQATSEERLKKSANGGGLLVPESILSSKRSFVFTEASSEKVLGFVSGGLPRETSVAADCELWAIYVHPDQQGRGIGNALLNAFKEEMKSLGHKRMLLWALKENHASRHFYEKSGGELQTVEKMFRWQGADVATEVAYAWDL